jgi:hypothetical protein
VKKRIWLVEGPVPFRIRIGHADVPQKVGAEITEVRMFTGSQSGEQLPRKIIYASIFCTFPESSVEVFHTHFQISCGYFRLFPDFTEYALPDKRDCLTLCVQKMHIFGMVRKLPPPERPSCF